MKAEMSPSLQEVADSQALAKALAANIAEQLTQAISARGTASLALSGVPTPIRY